MKPLACSRAKPSGNHATACSCSLKLATLAVRAMNSWASTCGLPVGSKASPTGVRHHLLKPCRSLPSGGHSEIPVGGAVEVNCVIAEQAPFHDHATVLAKDGTDVVEQSALRSPIDPVLHQGLR